MRFRLSLIAVLLFLYPVYSGFAQTTDSIFSKSDRLAYKGFEISRTAFIEDPRFPFLTSITTIRKNGKVLAKVDGCCFKEATRFGLFSFLGGQTKQIVVESYSGGAHCCMEYAIYELSSGFRLLFDGAKYSSDDVGYTMRPVDIDKDGIFEFIQSVMTFDYFYAPHSMSIFPDVVFAYDNRRKMFRPANQHYSTYLLRGIEKDLVTAKELNNKFNPDDIGFRQLYHSAMLQVVLKYIYAGKESIGWEFFESSYKLQDKADLKRDIKAHLATSVIYRSINPKFQTRRQN